MARQFKWGLSKELQDERQKVYAEIKRKREERRCKICKILFRTLKDKQEHDLNWGHKEL